MHCSPTRLHRLALELRDLRNLRDSVALIANDDELAARALALQADYAPSSGAITGLELDALLDLELTPAQLDALEQLRAAARLTGRADGRLHHHVAERLIAAGLAKRDGYYVSITRAGRIALERAARPAPLAKTRSRRALEASA